MILCCPHHPKDGNSDTTGPPTTSCKDTKDTSTKRRGGRPQPKMLPLSRWNHHPHLVVFFFFYGIFFCVVKSFSCFFLWLFFSVCVVFFVLIVWFFLLHEISRNLETPTVTPTSHPSVYLVPPRAKEHHTVPLSPKKKKRKTRKHTVQHKSLFWKSHINLSSLSSLSSCRRRRRCCCCCFRIQGLVPWYCFFHGSYYCYY